MSYKLFKPDRFLCEHDLSDYARGFKAAPVEVTNPASASGIADNTSIAGRYFLAKTILAFTKKPGCRAEPSAKMEKNPIADFDISWVYGCPHRCVYCHHIYLCKNYPYIAADPRVEMVENALRRIAADWKGDRPFICQAGRMTDLLALEHLTGWLARLIPFFSKEIAPHGQLLITTKSSNSAPLLAIDHRRTARIGISLSPEKQIREMEPGTAPLLARLDFLSKIVSAGYPVHISLSPVIPTGDYQRDYEKLFHSVNKSLLHGGTPQATDISIDVSVLTVKPESEVVVEELAPQAMDGMLTSRAEGRAVLTYPQETLDDALRYFRRALPQYFPETRILFIR